MQVGRQVRQWVADVTDSFEAAALGFDLTESLFNMAPFVLYSQA